MRLALLALAFAAGCASGGPTTHDRQAPDPNLGTPEDLWRDAPEGSWVRQRRHRRNERFETRWEGVHRKDAGDPEGVAAVPSAAPWARPGLYGHLLDSCPECGAMVDSWRRLPDERLEVGSTTFTCAVVEESLVAPGLHAPIRGTLRIWRSAAATTPGGVLRWKHESLPTRELRYVLVGEPAERCGRTVRLYRAEVHEKWPFWAPSVAVLEWSPDVPGKVLLFREELHGGGIEETTEIETLDFGGPARPR